MRMDFLIDFNFNQYQETAQYVRNECQKNLNRRQFNCIVDRQYTSFSVSPNISDNSYGLLQFHLGSVKFSVLESNNWKTVVEIGTWIYELKTPFTKLRLIHSIAYHQIVIERRLRVLTFTIHANPPSRKYINERNIAGDLLTRESEWER